MMAIYHIYKSILDETNVCLTAYLILYVLNSHEIDNSTYEFREYYDLHFKGLQNSQISKELGINKSTVTRHLKNLEQYVVKREKKYYRIAPLAIDKFDSVDLLHEKPIRMYKYLSKIFITPEQCLLISYLWDEVYKRNKEINIKQICSSLPMSDRHIHNNLKSWQQQGLISFDKGFIEFDIRIERILKCFI